MQFTNSKLTVNLQWQLDGDNLSLFNPAESRTYDGQIIENRKNLIIIKFTPPNYTYYYVMYKNHSSTQKPTFEFPDYMHDYFKLRREFDNIRLTLVANI